MHYFKAMSNSIDLYKGISLHIVPVRFILPCLYIDDVSSCFKNMSVPDSAKIKKILFKIFKSNELSIECNLIVTEFHDQLIKTCFSNVSRYIQFSLTVNVT